MNAPINNSLWRSNQAADPMYRAAGNLVGIWARGRRRITPWAYPRLRALAAVRFAVGIFLAGVSAVTLYRGYYGWAAVPLAGAALLFSIAYLDISVARSAAPRA